MLRLTVHQSESFNEETNSFVPSGEEFTVELEHSLFSMSKWECKWEIPFLGKTEKTGEQTLDYIKQMIVGPEPPWSFFESLKDTHFNEINTYINAKMTAAWFNERPNKRSNEIVTAEIVYYWMISLGIPFECQYWHFNRLTALIKVCNIKNAPKKKMSRSEAAARQRLMNDQRRNEMGTRG
jgi:hypothetical protein